MPPLLSWRLGGLAALLLSIAVACSRFGPVYPPRPMPSEGPPVADPEPSRVVAHLTVTSAGLRGAADDASPRQGEGTFPLLGKERRYTWQRDAFDVGFGQGRVTLRTKVTAVVETKLKDMTVPLDLRVDAEPVVSSEYVVKLQALDVKVTSSDTTLGIVDAVAGVYEKIAGAIREKLAGFAYDLRPLLREAYARVSKPIDLPFGDADGCAVLRVLEIEAGPTVLADGIEKDVALVVAPSVMLPCPETHVDDDVSLPPLSNVATLTPGPFAVTLPIAARYDELTRAMTMAFTDGKLFFSKEYPHAYMEKPELYESGGALVLKLHIGGPVHELGTDVELDGDLFLTGHPAVVDNELRVPDLEPTVETHNFLLSLKALRDIDKIRDEARAALRLDIGERLRSARAKLGDELTFGGGAKGCFQGDVDRVEVTGVYAHAAYLRVYVRVTARARATIPCPTDASQNVQPG
jgi:hypothetical protein